MSARACSSRECESASTSAASHSSAIPPAAGSSGKRIAGSGRLKLRPKRGGRLSVKVTVKPDGGAATTLTRKVKVRR